VREITLFAEALKDYIFQAIHPYDVDMIIETVKLAGGDKSPFKLNINGFPGNQQNDIHLSAKDSIFIFVEATIDPSESKSSFFAEDSIVFYTKEKIQSVMLKAYIQDVNVLKGHVIKDNVKFTNDKPYLIYDSLIVETSGILTIKEGTHLHFYKNAFLKVASSS